MIALRLRVALIIGYILNGCSFRSPTSYRTSLTRLQQGSSSSESVPSLSAMERILAEQGVSMDDLLRLQQRIVGESSHIDESIGAAESEANRERSNRIKRIKLEARSRIKESKERDAPPRPTLTKRMPKLPLVAKEPRAIVSKQSSIRVSEPRHEDAALEKSSGSASIQRIQARSSVESVREDRVAPRVSPRRQSNADEGHPSAHRPAEQRGERRTGGKSIPIEVSGVTLKEQVGVLVSRLGYPALHRLTGLRCFEKAPTVTSSLKALRVPSMEWARKKIEYLYVQELKKEAGR